MFSSQLDEGKHLVHGTCCTASWLITTSPASAELAAAGKPHASAQTHNMSAATVFISPPDTLQP